MSLAALASLKASAAECAAHAAVFGPDEAATGLLASDELARMRGGGTAESAGVPPTAACQAVAADQAPLTLLQLPAEALVLVFGRLNMCSLACIAATCSEVFREPMNPVEEALRQRAAARGRMCPDRLPQDFSSWPSHLAWLERRRDNSWAPVTAGATVWSLFVAEGGRLMRCGAEDENKQGMLGHGELETEDRMVPTPTLLPSMTGIRISSVSAGSGFNAAVSAAGTVYSWGNTRSLGHGDTEGSLVPKQVQALAGHRVLSVAAEHSPCLAVTESGEVFSWGWDCFGQCGHGSSNSHGLLPRRVEALTGVGARSASAGRLHSLVVTEKGALYSFGGGFNGQLGHGSNDHERSPKMVDALRNVRIAVTAASGDHSLACRGLRGLLLGRQLRGSVRPETQWRVRALATEGRGLEWDPGVLCGSLGQRQLCGDRSRRALHVGRRTERAARARRHSGSAAVKAR
jgi:hypothetical protein